MKTNITNRIADMIRKEVHSLLREYKGDPEEFVFRYRDANFAGGHYDHIFTGVLRKLKELHENKTTSQ